MTRPTSPNPLADAYRAASLAASVAETAYFASECTCESTRADDHADACPDRLIGPTWILAGEARDAAEAAWSESDEPRDYVIMSEGTRDDMIARPSDIERKLGEYARAGDWERERTIWIRAEARALDPATGEPTGERFRVTEALHPVAPRCNGRMSHHVWAAPHTLLGGLRENPGVIGSGGGVKISRVCRVCGTYRHEDTWAQDPSTGEQGLLARWYDAPDDRSLAWVAAVAAEHASDGCETSD